MKNTNWTVIACNVPGYIQGLGVVTESMMASVMQTAHIVIYGKYIHLRLMVVPKASMDMTCIIKVISLNMERQLKN